MNLSVFTFLADLSGELFSEDGLLDTSLKQSSDNVAETYYIMLFAGLTVFLLFLIYMKRMRINKLQKRAQRIVHILPSIPLRATVVTLQGEFLFCHKGTIASRLDSIDQEKFTPEMLPDHQRITAAVIRRRHSRHLIFQVRDEYFRADVTKIPTWVFGRGAALWIIQNITELYVSQQDIHERARWFSDTLDAVNNGVLTLDERGNIFHVNEYAAWFFGSERGRLEGRKLGEVVANMAPEAREKLLELTQCGLSGSAAVDIELDGVLPNVHIACSVLPMQCDGERTGAVLVLNDITKLYNLRKESEAELELLSSALDCSGDAIMALSREGRILTANTACEAFFRRKPEELKNRNLFELAQELFGDGHAGMISAVRAALEGKPCGNLPGKGVLRHVTFRLSATPLSGPNGPNGAILSLRETPPPALLKP